MTQARTVIKDINTAALLAECVDTLVAIAEATATGSPPSSRTCSAVVALDMRTKAEDMLERLSKSGVIPQQKK